MPTEEEITALQSDKKTKDRTNMQKKNRANFGYQHRRFSETAYYYVVALTTTRYLSSRDSSS
jgi:hypothetical protein